jgi:hypothetical protein
MISKTARGVLLGAMAVASLSACQPTVRLEAPEKPIEINLNVKIEQEVRVSIARDVQQAIANDPSLF